MFEISGLAIILAIITVALMGGFSSKKGRSSKTNKSEYNPILGECFTPLQVRLARENKIPMRIEVDIMGDNNSAQKKRVAGLNVGDSLIAAWSEHEDSDLFREYFIFFVDSSKKIYASAYGDDKYELARRFDFIQDVIIVELDKDEPRMVLDILFE